SLAATADVRATPTFELTLSTEARPRRSKSPELASASPFSAAAPTQRSSWRPRRFSPSVSRLCLAEALKPGRSPERRLTAPANAIACGLVSCPCVGLRDRPPCGDPCAPPRLKLWLCPHELSAAQAMPSPRTVAMLRTGR